MRRAYGKRDKIRERLDDGEVCVGKKSMEILPTLLIFVFGDRGGEMKGELIWIVWITRGSI